MNLRSFLGALIVPLLAVAYALYAWWEQSEGAYREDTTQYMMVLIVPVLALAAMVILQSLFEGWRRAREERLRAAAPEEPDAGRAAAAPADRGRILRPTLLIAASLLLVVSIDWLGYLVAFSVFVVAVLLAMGVRAPLRVAAIAISTMVLVHVVFIEILDQPLPRGLLESLSQ